MNLEHIFEFEAEYEMFPNKNIMKYMKLTIFEIFEKFINHKTHLGLFSSIISWKIIIQEDR